MCARRTDHLNPCPVGVLPNLLSDRLKKGNREIDFDLANWSVVDDFRDASSLFVTVVDH